jgi:hypothetical protein
MKNFIKQNPVKLSLALLTLLTSIWAIYTKASDNGNIYLSLHFIIELLFAYFVFSIIVVKLIEQFYFKRKFFSFYTSLVLLILLFSLLFDKFYSIIDLKAIGHGISLVIVTLLTVMIYFVYDRSKNKLEYLIYKNRKMEAEMVLLRQQINPHFLFNILNSIYNHSLQKSDDVAPMISRLSDMLRYQLEVSDLSVIPLKREVDFIENYLSFEEERLPQNITLNYFESIKKWDFQIPPNTLITLIENCFKHGISLEKDAFISINLHMIDDVLTLETSNTLPKQKPQKTTKTGLKNLRQRLEYKFDNRFSLTETITKDTYNSKLTLHL